MYTAQGLTEVEQRELSPDAFDEAPPTKFHRDYGICENCHTSIPKKRLKKIPETRYCKTCEIEHERAMRVETHKSFLKRLDFNIKDRQ